MHLNLNTFEKIDSGIIRCLVNLWLTTKRIFTINLSKIINILFYKLLSLDIEVSITIFCF